MLRRPFTKCPIFNAVACGNTAAQIAPCAAFNIPPNGAANPCTAPKPAFANDKPLSRLAKDISARAAVSAPLAYTAGKALIAAASRLSNTCL